MDFSFVFFYIVDGRTDRYSECTGSVQKGLCMKSSVCILSVIKQKICKACRYHFTGRTTVNSVPFSGIEEKEMLPS